MKRDPLICLCLAVILLSAVGVGCASNHAQRNRAQHRAEPRLHPIQKELQDIQAEAAALGHRYEDFVTAANLYARVFRIKRRYRGAEIDAVEQQLNQLRVSQIKALGDDLTRRIEEMPISPSSPAAETIARLEHLFNGLSDQQTQMPDVYLAYHRQVVAAMRSRAQTFADAHPRRTPTQAELEAEAERQRMIDQGICLTCEGSGQDAREYRRVPCPWSFGGHADCLHCYGSGYIMELNEDGKCTDCNGTGRSRR